MAEPCEDCGGSRDCKHCGGTGTITNEDIESFCNPCNGSGTCNVCKGSGEQPPTFDPW